MLGVKDVKKFIEDYRKTIRDHMKMVCDFLHVAYASKCRNKVIHSIDAIIDELVYYSTPQMVCQRLGLCDNTDGIPNIKYPADFRRTLVCARVEGSRYDGNDCVATDCVLCGELQQLNICGFRVLAPSLWTL